MNRAGAFVLASASVCAAFGQAHAQSCCADPASHELGVVGHCHTAALAVQLGYEWGHGSSDANGDYQGLNGAQVHDGVLGVGAGVRLWHPALQVNASIPLRVQYRKLPNLGGAAAVQPADANVALRWQVSEDAMRGFQSAQPSVELILASTAPTGRAASDSSQPTAADVTGSGSWLLGGGVKVLKSISARDALSLQVLYGYAFARTIAGPLGEERSFKPGNEVNLRLMSAHTLNLRWSWGLFGRVRVVGAVEQNGNRVPESAAHRLRFGAFVDHYLSHPGWQLTPSVIIDPPVNNFSRNVPFASLGLALALTRNF